MVERRDPEKTPFPQLGETVLSEDGTTWTWTAAADLGDEHQEAAWVQGDPALSRDELDAVEESENAKQTRLSTAHRVYALAFGSVRYAKREDQLLESDPPEAFVLCLAQSAMVDAILAVVDPDAKEGDREAATLTRFRAMLGDPEMATVQAHLEALRKSVSEDQQPDSVSGKTREHVAVLAELAGTLPNGSDARNTINAMVNARSAPPPGTADKLFRELMAAGVPQEAAWKAHSAATAFVSAF